MDGRAPDVPTDEFASILASVEPDASEEELARLAAELARADDAVARFLETDAAGRIAAEGPEGLSPEQRRVLARASRLLDRDWVVAHVTTEANQEPPASWRRAALDLLRWHAGPAQLPLLARLAAQGGGSTAGAVAFDPLGDAFRAAVVELLRRDPRAFDELSGVTDEFETLRGPLVRAVGATADPEGLGWLELQLDRAGMTGCALQEIRRIAPRASARRRAEVAQAVRPHLHSEHLPERVHAAGALAALGESDAVPALLSMLEEGSRGERRAACSALQELSGRKLPERAETWRAWHREELRWHEEESAAVLERLSSEDDAEVVAALRILSGRGLRRDHWAVRLARLLSTHSSPVVRSQVGLALARLGSPVVAEDLVLALEDPEPAVRRSACAALRSITGLSLPPVRDAWERALLEIL